MLSIKDFVTAQRAMWVKKLVLNDHASWKAYPTQILGKLIGLHTFNTSLDTKKNTFNIPTFYWQVLKSWIDIRDINKETKKVQKFEMNVYG
jgi:hypothetical protein